MNFPGAEGYADWKHWDVDDFGAYSSIEAAYFEAELHHAGIDTSKRLDVLELGFGNGGFLGWARTRGFRVAGVETLEPALQRARAAGMDSYRSVGDLPPDFLVDAVIAFDVFEHIPKGHLEQLLWDVGNHLKDGGRIIARFPNGGSPFGLYYQNGDLTHVTSLAEGAVSHLAAAAGLKVLFCGAPRLPIEGVGAVRGMRRLLQLGARFFVEAIVRHVYYDGRPACLAPNLLAVFCR
jgi:SAM-dependent methyltransferase